MQGKHPLNRPGFRILLSIVVLSLLLAACQGNSSDNQKATPQGTVSVLEATPGAGNTSNATAQAGAGVNQGTTSPNNGSGSAGGYGGSSTSPSSGSTSGGSNTPAAGTGTASAGNGSQIATVTPVPGNSSQTSGQNGSGSIPVTGGASQVQALQSEYIKLYQQANPSVVNIRVDVTQGSQSGVATGSGWIYDPQGHIVTNNHVVADGSNLLVTFFDGFQAPAKIIGTDPYSDLAVIQVQSLPKNVKPIQVADKDETQVGELVVAIGSPFGLGSTMTTGVISALGRDIPALVNNFSIPQAIQTDAAINPGNSGGPLIDMNGRVIGVNSQIATGGTNQSSGVGFAIPVSIVKLVVPALISGGQYSWPYLGVSGTTVDLLIQQANKLDVQQGAYIDQIVPGGPAAQAKLQGSNGNANVQGTQVPKGGDVVVAVDGKPTITYDALLAEIAMHKPGDTVKLTILRNGKQMDVQVKLGARPAGDTSNQSSGFPSGPLR